MQRDGRLAGRAEHFEDLAHIVVSLDGMTQRDVEVVGVTVASSLVGLTFHSAGAWSNYNWMGVCKSALEATGRYLARDLGAQGARCNLVAAGPLHTRAAGGIPGFDTLLRAWATGAPLAWDARDAGPVADAVLFLLSDLSRAITGEVLNVDGGYHAMAGALREPDGEALDSEPRPDAAPVRR